MLDRHLWSQASLRVLLNGNYDINGNNLLMFVAIREQIVANHVVVASVKSSMVAGKKNQCDIVSMLKLHNLPTYPVYSPSCTYLFTAVTAHATFARCSAFTSNALPKWH